jgi:hypothetical protein
MDACTGFLLTPIPKGGDAFHGGMPSHNTLPELQGTAHGKQRVQSGEHQTGVKLGRAAEQVRHLEARADRGLRHGDLCWAGSATTAQKNRQLKNHACLEHGPCGPAATFFDRPE